MPGCNPSSESGAPADTVAQLNGAIGYVGVRKVAKNWRALPSISSPAKIGPPVWWPKVILENFHEEPTAPPATEGAARNSTTGSQSASLIHIKNDKPAFSDSKAVGHAQPTALPSSPYVPCSWTAFVGLSNWCHLSSLPSVQKGDASVRQSKNSACVVALKLRSVDNSLLGRLSDAVLEPASKYSHQQHCHT